MDILEKFVKTSLCFSPNYDGNKVKVSVGKWLPNTNTYYVLIIGRDDSSLQTEELTYEQAIMLYDSIKFVDSETTLKFKNSKNNNGFTYSLYSDRPLRDLE
jgi:hypothetical protein